MKVKSQRSKVKCQKCLNTNTLLPFGLCLLPFDFCFPARRRQKGAISVQMLVFMVPVFFGLMGFAIDLGRLYLVRGELNIAAEAMAQAAAAKLNGTDASLDSASVAARLALDNATGHGNKYNFGSLVIGESTATLSSEVQDPFFFDTVAGATADGLGTQAGGTTARHVRVDISAEAPLVFWGFLPIARDRRTRIAARAVAGVSAPLCTACGIEPFAIAALALDDTTDFGFTVGSRYTLGYQCNGAAQPPAIAGTLQRVPYLIINRFDDQSTVEELTQLYRVGAQGLVGSANSALACVRVTGEEIVWATVTPTGCNTNSVPVGVQASLCGMASRFQPDAPGACAIVTDVGNVVTSYTPDSDLTDLDDYPSYTGNGRRLITVPIVDTLVASGPMVVQGFRQFLVEPVTGDTTLNVVDTNGRFSALYLGTVAPVKQGRFDGCQLAVGPGKVVLHR